jgi:hypothetical protein
VRIAVRRDATPLLPRSYSSFCVDRHGAPAETGSSDFCVSGVQCECHQNSRPTMGSRRSLMLRNSLESSAVRGARTRAAGRIDCAAFLDAGDGRYLEVFGPGPTASIRRSATATGGGAHRPPGSGRAAGSHPSLWSKVRSVSPSGERHSSHISPKATGSPSTRAMANGTFPSGSSRHS